MRSLSGKEIALVELKQSQLKMCRAPVLKTPACRFPQDIPQQLNSFDCGIFTIVFAQQLARDSPFNFTQFHMTNFRLSIAAYLMQVSPMSSEIARILLISLPSNLIIDQLIELVESPSSCSYRHKLNLARQTTFLGANRTLLRL